MYSELSILHTVKVPSVYSVRLLHTIPSELLHTHVLALQMPLFLTSISWIGMWDMTSENLGVMYHQHLLSPQSWIWVFSCSVSQENRADLPSSSSYFRSLTKCCKNTGRLTVICILIKRPYGWYKKPIDTHLEITLRLSNLLTLSCTQDLYAEPNIFTSLPNDNSHSPVMSGVLPHVGSGSFHLITEPEAIGFTC